MPAAVALGVLLAAAGLVAVVVGSAGVGTPLIVLGLIVGVVGGGFGRA